MLTHFDQQGATAFITDIGADTWSVCLPLYSQCLDSASHVGVAQEAVNGQMNT